MTAGERIEDRRRRSPSVLGAHETSAMAVVLVEFFSAGLTARRAQEFVDFGLDVVVVDNSGSYKGPGTIVRPLSNLGFGAACNAGVARLGADVEVVVFVNPDVDVSGSELHALASALLTSGFSALAPTVVGDRYRTEGFAIPRGLKEPLLVLVDCLRVLLPLRRTIAATGDRRRPDTGACEPAERLGRFGSGACLAVDRQAFDAVGGFDEEFFLYVEDLDLWERLSTVGPVGFLRDVRVVHASGTGSDASAIQRTLLRWAGRELYAQKRHGKWRGVRMVHLLGLRALPRGGEPVAMAVRSGMRARMSPARLQRHVRSVAAAPHSGGADVVRVRLGWSRTPVGIARDDLVLDVGSGAFPNDRADVLCERALVREHRVAVVDRPLVVADAVALPFRNGAFDFVIVSHLAEHVENPVELVSELTRVAVAGYVETPSPIFERLFPTANHVWKVERVGRSRLRFHRNVRQGGAVERIGEVVAPWFWAGTRAGTQMAGRRRQRALNCGARALRAFGNRSGFSVTRVLFDSSEGLTAEVER